MDKDKKLSVFTEYCTGCGLCASVSDVRLINDSKGFIYPQLEERHIDLCEKVCPSSGYAMRNYSNGRILGKIIETKVGWSSNNEIRRLASSGGILTALCVYLIREKKVDGIIQTKKDVNDVRKTETIVSTTIEDVLSCMGSRYSTSSPLSNIKKMIETEKRYAFIGKPCDVSALQMYKRTTKDKWTEQIVYMFSFFCAGQPSLEANDRLLRFLDCKDYRECKDLQYRGNGWPGYATAFLNNGKENKIDYETSWMKILGRDVKRICRFCSDGTGEYADISCGDAWYLTKNLKPDLSEHPGRNVILCRTKEGVALLNAVVKNGMITVKDYDVEKDKLDKSQPYHYTRKAALSSLKFAMLLCGKTFPHYDRKILNSFSKDLSFKNKLLRFLGTVQRVWNNKL